MNAKNQPRRGYQAIVQVPPVYQRWLVHLLMALLRWLPHRARLGMARKLGPRLLLRNRRRRQIVDVNLRTCFPDLPELDRARLRDEFAERFVFCALDTARLWPGPRESLFRWVTFEGEEHLQASLDAGRPVILLVPHTVGLEAGGLALAARYPMLGLTSEAKSGLEQWIFRRLRELYCDHVLDRTAPVRRVIREIRSGRILYYLPDEDHGHLKKSVFVPFFGKPTATLLGAGRLLAIADADVIPAVTLLDSSTGRYTVRIFAKLKDLSSDDAEHNCRVIRAELERLIRLQATDYIWTLRVFNNQPCGRANPDYPAPSIPVADE